MVVEMSLQGEDGRSRMVEAPQKGRSASCLFDEVALLLWLQGRVMAIESGASREGGTA